MLDWHAIAPYEELVKVPAQIFVPGRSSIKPWREALFQVAEKLACVWPINIHFAEQWESDPISVPRKLLDVTVAASFLLTKLIAREGKHLQQALSM